MDPDHIARVAITAEAADLIRRLSSAHGPVMFHQSGGCCDGSSPTWYPAGEFRAGAADVELGDQIEGMVRRSRCGWRLGSSAAGAPHLTIDVVPRRGDGFSSKHPNGCDS